VSKAGKVFAVLVALAWAVAPVAEAQAPIRISETRRVCVLGPAPGNNERQDSGRPFLDAGQLGGA
jgi:uracil-DNA glycosylase